jgi:hypothetical protein
MGLFDAVEWAMKNKADTSKSTMVLAVQLRAATPARVVQMQWRRPGR